MKLIFAPISIVLGLIAGLAGKKIFEQVWGRSSASSKASSTTAPAPRSRKSPAPGLARRLPNGSESAASG
jgi:hypothetical protein